MFAQFSCVFELAVSEGSSVVSIAGFKVIFSEPNVCFFSLVVLSFKGPTE